MNPIDIIREARDKTIASIAAVTAGRAQLVQRTAELEAQLTAIRNKHVPLDEMEARARLAVSARGAEWLRKYANELLFGQYSIAMGRLDVEARLPGWSGHEDPLSQFGALCVVDPDAALQRVMTLALASGQYAPGLAKEEREQLEARLERERHLADQAETELVDAAISAGMELKHRPEVVARREQIKQHRSNVMKQIDHFTKRNVAEKSNLDPDPHRDRIRELEQQLEALQ